jgi:pimeloyl-ACP methyl ester carboxylesterase
MEKKHIYLISGLGSDERVFRYLDLDAYSVHYIQWIPPMHKENLAAYAARLIKQITTPDPVLIGLSMGGMIAVEIGKLISTEKIILISSAKGASELPGYFGFFGKLKLHRYLPDFLLLRPNKVFYNLFGVYNRREKVILRDVLRDTDPKFARWAMDAILEWDNTETRGTVIHIHGTNDKIIPLRNIESPDYIIQDARHSMVFQQPKQITALLKKIIG